jgi:CDI immunity protein
MKLIQSLFKHFNQGEKSTKEPIKLDKLRTDVWFNGDFYYTQSKTCGGSLGDPDGKYYYLAPDISDQLLGEAVLDVLMLCRDIDLAEGENYSVESKKIAERSIKITAEKTQAEMIKYGYKNERAKFRNMLVCNVVSEKGLISISPTNHDRLDGWAGISDDAFINVTLAANSPPGAVAAALREGFRRCIDSYGGKKNPPATKTISAPDLSNSKLQGEDRLLELLCDGDEISISSARQFLKEDGFPEWHRLGRALSEAKHGLSEDYKRAPGNFYGGARDLVEKLGLGEYVQSEAAEQAEEQEDVFAQVEYFKIWLNKTSYQVLHLNPKDDQFELTIVQKRYAAEIIQLAKTLKNIEMTDKL